MEDRGVDGDSGGTATSEHPRSEESQEGGGKRDMMWAKTYLDHFGSQHTY